MQRLPISACAPAFCASSFSAHIDSAGQLAQSKFRRLSEDLGAAPSYKALLHAERLGKTGATTTFGAKLGLSL